MRNACDRSTRKRFPDDGTSFTCQIHRIGVCGSPGESLVTATVLLVEDETFVLMHVAAMLEDDGYEVLMATRGIEAMEALNRDGHRLNAVITDIRLPGTIDGWQIARTAREQRPDLPVLYMSGDGARDWLSHGVPESLMLTKPFTTSQLTGALSQLTRAAA
jgi:two-component system cell cycle response regulator CpdR